MNLFMFKGRLYRKLKRHDATTKVEAVTEADLEHLLQTIDDSFDGANLTDLDKIQQSYQRVTNGEILRRHW